MKIYRYQCIVIVALATSFCPAPLVHAQPGAESSEDDIPVLPRTTVVGEPNPFPSSPLDDDAVFTPNRAATSSRGNASSITVITEEQIQQTGQTSVLEVLRRTVGVDVVQSGGPGRITSVFMRGANSEHTKIMLDGISVNDPSHPSRSFDFSTLSLDNIERIEVLRGPQSMVYGSDALGGVINIITKRGEGPLTTTTSLMGGTYGTHNEAVNVSGGDDRFYYSLSGSYFDTDGFSAIQERFGGIEIDGFQSATLSGRVGWNLTENLNVDYVYRYIDSDADVDDFLADDLSEDNRRNQFFTRVQLQSLIMDGLIEQKVGFNLNDTSLRDELGFTPLFEGQSRQVDYQANLRLTEWNTFTAGFDYMQEEASSTDQSLTRQNLFGTYVQDQFSLWDRSFTTIGVRWDDHSSAGRADTYRLTQLFRVTETATSFHGTIGRGFRAPALFQKFGFGGNPDLRPEFSKGWDVGVTQQMFGSDATLDVTYFRNDFQNLIFFDFPTFMNQNVGLARTSGVELTLEAWLLENTMLSATYTNTRTKDLATNLDLLRRPRDKATFGVQQYFWDRLANVNVYVLYVGPRIDFDDTFTRAKLDDYFLVNLSGSVQLTNRCEIFSRIDNLFGENYEEVFGFNTAGFSIFSGMRLTF